MILDRLENADRYAPLHQAFRAAFELLRGFDFASAATGPAEIDGKRLTINVIRGEGKSKQDAKLEMHERYIDIQYMVEGEEVFGWKVTADCAEPIGEFNAEKDILKYEDEPDGYFPLLPGMFAVFYPEDAHAPMVGSGPMSKIVVKVLLDWE